MTDQPSENDVDIARLLYHVFSETNAPDTDNKYMVEFLRELDDCMVGGSYRHQLQIKHHGKRYTMTIRITRDWM